MAESVSTGAMVATAPAVGLGVVAIKCMYMLLCRRGEREQSTRRR